MMSMAAALPAVATPPPALATRIESRAPSHRISANSASLSPNRTARWSRVPARPNSAPRRQCHVRVAASSLSTMPPAEVQVMKLKAVPVTPEAFAPYGTVVLPSEDGVEFGAEDAALDLSKGLPRVYIMRLRDRKLGFDNITHHASVTQCLGAAGGGVWYLGVARASVVDPPPSAEEAAAAGLRESKAGHWYRPPRPEDIVVFKAQGACILKLHAGTWHAGPLFTEPFMDFFNLELADTNVVDHTTHCFAKDDHVAFEFDA